MVSEKLGSDWYGFCINFGGTTILLDEYDPYLVSTRIFNMLRYVRLSRLRTSMQTLQHLGVAVWRCARGKTWQQNTINSKNKILA